MSISYHHNLMYNDLKDSIEKFSWNSQQTKVALKTALACTTAILIANAIKLNYPCWCGISALVMMKSNVGASFSKGWMRTGGCTLGCILTIFFMGFFVQNPLFFSFFIFIGIFLGFYAGVRAKHGYFWMYMLANMTLISFISITNPYGKFTIDIVFYRSAEVFLGVIVSWLYNILLWPDFAGNQISDQLKTLISKTLLLHSNLIKLITAKKAVIGYIVKDKNDIEIRLKKIKALITDIKTEKLLRNDKTEYSMIIQIIESRLVRLNSLLNNISENNDFISLKIHKNFFKKLINNFNKLSAIEDYNGNIFKKNLLNINIFNSQLLENYNSNESRNYPFSDILFFYEFVHYIESYYKDLIRISSNNFDHTSLITKKQLELSSDYLTLNFYSYSLNLYIPSLINATKGGLAVLFTFWFCMWLQIPGGMMNMSVAIIAVFAPQLDTLASKHKGLLRMTGCLFGGAAGLFLLLFGIESTSIFFIIIFVFSFFSAYIFGGRPGIAYVGLQAGLAFFLCIADGFSQVTSIGTVLERLTGIILAISFMWIVNFIIWPENLQKSLKNKIINLKNNLVNYLNTDIYKFFKNPTLKQNKPPVFEVSNINSMFNVIKNQEELPESSILSISSWVFLVEKITEKLAIITLTDSEVMHLLNKIYPNLFEQFLNNTNSSIQFIYTDRSVILSSIDDNSEIINKLLAEIRKKEIIKNKSIEFKKHFSSLILSMQRILSDLKQLVQIDMNLDTLSE